MSPASDLLWGLFGPLLIATPRILAAVTVAPLFPASLFPMLLRNTIVLSLALCLYPYLADDVPSITLSLFSWLALIGKETLVGALIGLAVGTLVWAFESVGALIDTQTGMGNGQLFDPFGGHQGGPMASFMARLSIMLFVASGGLYVFVSLLFESFRLWPVAAFHPTLNANIVDLATGYVGSLAQTIVRLAAPVVLLLALVDLGFGLLNRVVPQLNVFFFTMPIKGVLAALMIAIYLSYLIDIASGQLDDLKLWLERLIPVLASSGQTEALQQRISAIP